MRLSHVFAVAAVAGLALVGGQAPASAAQMGAVVPAVQKNVQSADVVEVGRRHWRKHRRWNRRHGWRRGYYRPYYGYGYRRHYYGGPSFSLRIGPRRRHWRRRYW